MLPKDVPVSFILQTFHDCGADVDAAEPDCESKHVRAVEDESAVIVVTDKSPSKVLRKFTDTYEENK